MPPLLCTVRNCEGVLDLLGTTYRCQFGHSFDVAREGYVNLLQPQDRRAKRPGDSRESLQARRRFVDAGHAERLFKELASIAFELLKPGAAILDVGCGEGAFAGLLATSEASSVDGLDISTNAIALAARRHREVRFVVGNADRQLPYAATSFDLVTSITSRRSQVEFARILDPAGHVLVAVPARDDLAELRALVLGSAQSRDRSNTVCSELEGAFSLVDRHTVRHTSNLDAAAVRDLLASTYRGARASQQEAVERIDAIDVTRSLDVLVFAPR